MSRTAKQAARRAPQRARDLAPSPENPRTITEAQLAALGRAMQQFGDLSGVIFNRQTGHLVGGHQRLKHLPASAKITRVERFAKPTEVGTVALGFIELEGERWSYREVEWPLDVERLANIAANAHGGDFETAQLAAIIGKLDASGAADDELLGLSPAFLRSLRERIAGNGDAWGEALGKLPTGSEASGGVQTMTFTLRAEDVALVERALREELAQAKRDGEEPPEDTNRNAWALVRMLARAWPE